MDSETAIKLIQELAMSVYTHTVMRNSEIALESKGMELVESQRHKMQDIKVESRASLRGHATTLLREILHRDPTAQEIQAVVSVLD